MAVIDGVGVWETGTHASPYATIFHTTPVPPPTLMSVLIIHLSTVPNLKGGDVYCSVTITSSGKP